MEILLLVALFLLSGAFSLSEMAVVSSRKPRLQAAANDGRAGAKTALDLSNDSTSFLATIQVGITIIAVTSGALGEARLAGRFAELVSRWPAAAPHAETLGTVLSVSFVTIASLLLGELVPKRLALINPEYAASLVARPMRMLSRIAHPIVWTLGKATEGIVSLFVRRDHEDAPVTREEIEVMVDEGVEHGIVDQHQHTIVKRAFRLDDLKVTGVMTPREAIAFVDLARPDAERTRQVVEGAHSRLPLVRGTLDDVQGIVLTRTLLADALAGRPPDFSVHEAPLFIGETATVSGVVAAFREHQQPIALVVDDAKRVVGLVTLNDVMEAVIGDVATVEDEDEPDCVRRDDGSWLVDGAVTVERLRDVVKLGEPLPGDESAKGTGNLRDYVARRLQGAPRPHAAVRVGDVTLEVADVDRGRIDKLLVTVHPREQLSSSEDAR